LAFNTLGAFISVGGRRRDTTTAKASVSCLLLSLYSLCFLLYFSVFFGRTTKVINSLKTCNFPQNKTNGEIKVKRDRNLPRRRQLKVECSLFRTDRLINIFLTCSAEKRPEKTRKNIRRNRNKMKVPPCCINMPAVAMGNMSNMNS